MLIIINEAVDRTGLHSRTKDICLTESDVQKAIAFCGVYRTNLRELDQHIESLHMSFWQGDGVTELYFKFSVTILNPLTQKSLSTDSVKDVMSRLDSKDTLLWALRRTHMILTLPLARLEESMTRLKRSCVRLETLFQPTHKRTA